MNKKEIFDRLAEVGEQMRSLIEAAEGEKRSLTQSEQEQFNSLEQEARMLQNRSRLPEAVKLEAEQDLKQRFAQAVADATQSGTTLNIQTRSIMGEAVVHDTSVPVLQQDLLKPLEKGFVLDRIGVKMMYNVHGTPMWPSVNGNEAFVLGENEEVQSSTLAFEKISSQPKRISMNYQLSRRAIHQSNLGLYNFVMWELGMGVARKLNHILLDKQAHGEYNGPFLNTDAERTLTRKHATDITFEEVVALEYSVLSSLTDSLSTKACYVMNYKTAEKLRTTPIVAGQSEMILKVLVEPGTNRRYGVMNGYTVEFSNYAPDGYIYFADYGYLGIPQYGSIDIVVDPYTLARKNAVQFTLNTEMDMVRIRKEAFAVSKPKGA